MMCMQQRTEEDKSRGPGNRETRVSSTSEVVTKVIKISLRYSIDENGLTRGHSDI